MNQNEIIIKHLKKYTNINPLEALKLYGIFRLSSRICECRQLGYRIDTEFVTNKKTNKTYAKYIYRGE